jgi:uncharacterized protein (DUF1330 family)
MSAYLIVHRREITDSEALKAYGEGVGATIAKFGGKVLVRSDAFDVLEGDWQTGQKAVDSKPQRIVVVEFPDMAALRAWYGSDEYAPLKATRQNSSLSDFIAVEGQ